MIVGQKTPASTLTFEPNCPFVTAWEHFLEPQTAFSRALLGEILQVRELPKVD